MVHLARGHENGTLALITLIPTILFYGLAYPLLLLLIPLSLLGLIGHFFFFRDPDREVTINTQLIIAPADGKIYEIDKNNGIIKIRMSLMNIHVNRAPVSGRVTSIRVQEGKHWPFFSFLRRGTLENARQTICISNPTGNFLVVQIVGILARRCTSYVAADDQMQQGDRLGIVHYGSEVDIHFPPNKFEILVEQNTKTKAGITPLAKIKKTVAIPKL